MNTISLLSLIERLNTINYVLCFLYRRRHAKLTQVYFYSFLLYFILLQRGIYPIQ